MTVLKLHNDHDGPVQLLLEPSGQHFVMEPGSTFEVVPQRDEQLEIYHQDPDLMVSGAIAKVIKDGAVLASWEDALQPGGEVTSNVTRIGSATELRHYLEHSGEQISLRADGALLFRQILGRSWVARAQWRDHQDIIHVETPLGISAPLEREAALAVTISRIHATNAIPGFQMLRSEDKPEVELTYWVVLLLDEQRSISTNALSRALKICFDMVVRFSDRLEAVAQGKPDPEA